MVKDPYAALNLPHTATIAEIKKAYRTLARQCHPDRCANPEQTKDFTELASAYAILSDPRRKAQYDHIYKYGGFDEEKEETPAPSAAQPTSQPTSGGRWNEEGKSVGIGYTCTDPLLTFLWTQGKIRSTKTLAGIQIPSRMSMGRGGFRFTFSSGQCLKSDPATGLQTYTTQTTQFSNGQKFTRSEKHILHNDGRKEVVVVDTGSNGDHQTRRYFVAQTAHEQAAAAAADNWYGSLWREVKDKLTMCYSPCSAVMTQ